MRASPLLVSLLVLLGSLTLAAPSGAQAVAPLLVDAGTTQVAYDNVDLVLDGQARGGLAPYAFAWTGAAASRFSDPASAAPVFSTAGLAIGNYTLTLTVTDALGTVVSDTVVHRVDKTTVALNVISTATAGVPDEEHGESLDARTFAIVIPPRTGFLRAYVEWDAAQTPTPDFDLQVAGFDGVFVDPSQGHEGTNPETFFFKDPFQGNWRVHVQPVVALNARFHVETRLGSVAHFPEARANGPYEFGTSQVQALSGQAVGGVAPYTLEWDADGDGWFETAGASAVSSFPAGTHAATFRVTDATGLSMASTVQVLVHDNDAVLKMICGGETSFPYWAMEFTASRGTCWLHGGHHTYYARGTYAFQGGHGLLFAVEQELAPSAEVVNASHPLQAPIHLQTSLDGQTWTDVGVALYDYGVLRQPVWFTLEGQGQAFRFLRLHAPLSLSQGLSGYLDHSDLRIVVDELPTLSAPASATTRSLSCLRGDVMEDFFATHPCTFGGIDRYDAPSFFHTYVAGPSSGLTRVSGTFVLAPWRSDDFFSGEPASGAASTLAYVQVSEDGVNWTDVAAVTALFGEPASFSVALDGSAATFVRLFPEYHANFDRWQTLAPHHHPRAFFVHSEVTLEGALNDWT